jgi:hypothetical protein
MDDFPEQAPDQEPTPVALKEFKNPQDELANGLSTRLKPRISGVSQEARSRTSLSDDGRLRPSSVADDISKTVKEVIYGRNDYPYDQQRLITKYGNNIVNSIRIGRTPLPSILTKVLNVITFGGFQKLVSKSYDDLFHLFSIISLDNGIDILAEKNQSINMKAVNNYNPKGAEYIDINVPSGLTFAELLNNTRKRMGKDFFNYHPTNNNCQDWIIALLQGSGLLTNSAKDFIKQNVVSIFTKYPRTRKLMATLTKLGTASDVISKGLKLKFI